MRKNQTGSNMYEFITHMWSPIRGQCPHDCIYCYMKRYPQGDMRIDYKMLHENLGNGHFIFVGHTIDMFAAGVPHGWIDEVIWRTKLHPLNKYLFQSKNPARFMEFRGKYPPDVVFATTIETNRRQYVESKAPPYEARAAVLGVLAELGYTTMVTIEPILDFDVNHLAALVNVARPKWVNIGADSKGHNLPEPDEESVRKLIAELRSYNHELVLKGNLARISGVE